MLRQAKAIRSRQPNNFHFYYEEIITMDGFTITLPIVGAKEPQEFGIKAPNGIVARDHYKMRRIETSHGEDAADRLLYEKQIKAELKQLKIGGEKENAKRIAEIKKELKVIEEQRSEADTAWFDLKNKNCYFILDTTLPFEKIDWDKADRRQVNGAIDFFIHSVNDSSFRDNS